MKKKNWTPQEEEHLDKLCKECSSFSEAFRQYSFISGRTERSIKAHYYWKKQKTKKSWKKTIRNGLKRILASLRIV